MFILRLLTGFAVFGILSLGPVFFILQPKWSFRKANLILLLLPFLKSFSVFTLPLECFWMTPPSNPRLLSHVLTPLFLAFHVPVMLNFCHFLKCMLQSFLPCCPSACQLPSLPISVLLYPQPNWLTHTSSLYLNMLREHSALSLDLEPLLCVSTGPCNYCIIHHNYFDVCLHCLKLKIGF